MGLSSDRNCNRIKWNVKRVKEAHKVHMPYMVLWEGEEKGAMCQNTNMNGVTGYGLTSAPSLLDRPAVPGRSGVGGALFAAV